MLPGGRAAGGNAAVVDGILEELLPPLRDWRRHVRSPILYFHPDRVSGDFANSLSAGGKRPGQLTSSSTAAAVKRGRKRTLRVRSGTAREHSDHLLAAVGSPAA